MKITSLSETSDSFPTLEVEYEDLLTYRYAPDARGTNGLIDCLGIVLEIYKRAGLLLPDPRYSGQALDSFYSLFSEIETADTLYDVIHMSRDGQDHLWVVVRPGLALSVRRVVNVCLRKVAPIEALEGTTSYRVKPECLP